jgi:multidrug resistance protein MdtO
MNDVVDYEFGVDRKLHKHTGETILRAALTSVAFFWNQFAILHSERDRDFLTEPDLIKLRGILADGMDDMARSVTQKTTFTAIHIEDLLGRSTYAHPHYGEYVQNSIARFDELQNEVAQLRLQP